MQNSSKNDIKLLYDKGKNISNPKKITELFNIYFVNVDLVLIAKYLKLKHFSVHARMRISDHTCACVCVHVCLCLCLCACVLVNICSENFFAPLIIKVNILDSCVVSSLLCPLCYASETWGYSGKHVEVVYRNGLRTALRVRQSTCNKITY